MTIWVRRRRALRSWIRLFHSGEVHTATGTCDSAHPRFLLPRPRARDTRAEELCCRPRAGDATEWSLCMRLGLRTNTRQSTGCEAEARDRRSELRLASGAGRRTSSPRECDGARAARTTNGRRGWDLVATLRQMKTYAGDISYLKLEPCLTSILRRLQKLCRDGARAGTPLCDMTARGDGLCDLLVIHLPSPDERFEGGRLQLALAFRRAERRPRQRAAKKRLSVILRLADVRPRVIAALVVRTMYIGQLEHCHRLCLPLEMYVGFCVGMWRPEIESWSRQRRQTVKRHG